MLEKPNIIIIMTVKSKSCVLKRSTIYFLFTAGRVRNDISETRIILSFGRR
jgi:hypothetical protein